MEEESPKIGDLSIRDYAMSSHAEFWSGREDELGQLINQATSEITELEEAATEIQLPKTAEDARHIKAVWILSGAGTYKIPITTTPGDLVYADKPWGQGTDKKRIDHTTDLIKKISIIASGNCSTEDINSYEISDEEIWELIKKYGPYLIYNGIPIQNSDLISAIEGGSLIFPKEKLFIPRGDASRTLDQIKTLKFPDVDFNENDKVGIVSHAPHLARVMRMVNKYKPLPEEASVQLYPLVFENPGNEKEFANSEMRGIIGYISQGQATIEPYPYKF